MTQREYRQRITELRGELEREREWTGIMMRDLEAMRARALTAEDSVSVLKVHLENMTAERNRAFDSLHWTRQMP